MTSYERFNHKSKLYGQFQRFNAIDGSVEMLKNGRVLIKMKNCKTFYEAQTASRPKGNYSPPHQIKSYYVSGTKIFLWRYTTFAFKVIQECRSWASRNDAVQMFFLTPNRKMLAEKFVK